MTPSCSSSAPIWREIADWLSFSPSPACVKLPASATAWKMRSLSQSITLPPAPPPYSAACAEPRLLGRQPLLGLERGHAAGAGRRHGLAEDLVLHVARRVDALDVGRRRIGPGQQIALAVHGELALEQLGVGRMADGDEHAVGRQRALGAGLDVAQPHRLDQRRRRASRPVISSSTVSQSTVTLGFLNSRSCRIFSARKLSRRWTRVTFDAWCVR